MTRRSVALWPDRLTVWRWHFLSGLFCLPFVAWLCLTGTIYLFKPQIDHWIDRPYDHLTAQGVAATPREVVLIAMQAVPDSRFLAYQLPDASQQAVRVILDRQGDAVRVYVDPFSRRVMKTVSEERRFERVVFKLHGQLLLGNLGSAIVEMAASWTIVLILTGFYLWWPREPSGCGGVFYPRVVRRGRTAWRDLHAVTGAWVSLLLALFLVSGLPWSFVWGHALSRVETMFQTVRLVQDWEIGAQTARALMIQDGAKPERPGLASHRDAMPGMDMKPPATIDLDDLGALDTVVSHAEQLDFPSPVLVTPPAGSWQSWHVRSDTQNRVVRIGAHLSPEGAIVDVERFGAKPLPDRVIAYGVAVHEGRLFGIANQVLNLIVAVALLVLSLAACVLWLQRRPPGQLGWPKGSEDRRSGIVVCILAVLLGVLLPELGLALTILVVGAACLRIRDRTMTI